MGSGTQGLEGSETNTKAEQYPCDLSGARHTQKRQHRGARPGLLEASPVTVWSTTRTIGKGPAPIVTTKVELDVTSGRVLFLLRITLLGQSSL